MKIVVAGGSGHLGRLLTGAFVERGDDVVVLTRTKRKPEPSRGKPALVHWDGVHLGDWKGAIDGADVVINLAGRSVDCRYTARNLREMFDSRIQSTRAIGRAIASAARPPETWLQMSTATIYAHRYDADNTEANGILGGEEPDVPAYWRFSTDIATLWESAMDETETPSTRKVALRSAMVMSPTAGGPFTVLSNLTRVGLGGAIVSGRQYMSWIHDLDFVRAIDFIMGTQALSGPLNLAAPTPLPQRDFMAALRSAWGVSVGLPTARWMLWLGAFVLRTDPELVLKSRRVVPGRLVDAGFEFRFPEWTSAAVDLVSRRRSRRPESLPLAS